MFKTVTTGVSQATPSGRPERARPRDRRRWNLLHAIRRSVEMVLIALLAFWSLGATTAEARVLWRYQLDSSFAGEFIGVGPDGTVYVTDSADLYALSPAGALAWRLPGGGGRRPVAIGADGTIYTGDSGVIAVRPDGTVDWTFEPQGLRDLLVGPGVAPDGNVYAVHNTLGGGIGAFALDTDGRLLWSDEGDPPIATAQPGNADIQFGSVGDGRFYFGAPTDPPAGPTVRAFSYSGGQVWSLAESCQSLPVIDPDGRLVVVGAGACGVSTYDRDASLVWNAAPPSGSAALVLPAVGPDGAIYTGRWFSDRA